MFKSTEHFESRFQRIASWSCRPRHDLSDSVRYGDLSFDRYALFTPEMRHALVSLLSELVIHRRASTDEGERRELLVLQRRMEKFLAGSKAARPKARTFSQCYMFAAEGILHADIHAQILDAAHSIYHGKGNKLESA